MAGLQFSLGGLVEIIRLLIGPEQKFDPLDHVYGRKSNLKLFSANGELKGRRGKK